MIDPTAGDLEAMLNSAVPISDPIKRTRWLEHGMAYVQAIAGPGGKETTEDLAEVVQEAYLTWPEAWPEIGFRVTA